jgi:hypothetical protein
MHNVNTNETNSSIKAKIAVSYFPTTTNKLRTIFKKHQVQVIPKSDRKLKAQLPHLKPSRQPKTKNLKLIGSVVEQKTVIKNTLDKERGH